MFTSGPVLWIIAIAIGALVLGGAIAYSTMRARTTTRGEEAAGEQATRNIYHKDESRPR